MILARIRAFFARLLGLVPTKTGRFLAGDQLAWRGHVGVAPLLWPKREYLLYVPRGYRWWSRHALVVLLHGCRQTPEDLAAGTRIREVADQHRWLVLMPRQSDKANRWSCWNWFDPATAAGGGEAAIVMAQVKAVRRGYRVHSRRIFAAGMSAGGSLAATLGVRHPQLFRGVFVHSGLACGAASSPSAAIGVMSRGADTDPQAIGEEARAQSGGAARVPLLAVHGEDDDVVAKVNAFQLVRQYLALNGRAPGDSAKGELPAADDARVIALGEGREMRVADYRAGKRRVARLVRVPRLGHAWSGGDAKYPYHAAPLPDATRLLADFVEGRDPGVQ